MFVKKGKKRVKNEIVSGKRGGERETGLQIKENNSRVKEITESDVLC